MRWAVLALFHSKHRYLYVPLLPFCAQEEAVHRGVCVNIVWVLQCAWMRCMSLCGSDLSARTGDRVRGSSLYKKCSQQLRWGGGSFSAAIVRRLTLLVGWDVPMKVQEGWLCVCGRREMGMRASGLKASPKGSRQC